VLEDMGFIVPVGEWVLRTACAQIKVWEDAGLSPPRVAVNLSTQQFKQDLAGIVPRILRETGLDPARLELEITEDALMENVEAHSATLDRLKGAESGLRVSIDDFGTGRSSLSHLKSLPLDMLKIDKSFVRDIASDPDNATVVDAIIDLAHDLRLEVIAEGVETEDQVVYLHNRGCDQVQGYYFSEPRSADAFAALLKSGKTFPVPGQLRDRAGKDRPEIIPG
jgi:EAL domain-containing protein (putative c-di-GMP-specific phosphodiesterase class I)